MVLPPCTNKVITALGERPLPAVEGVAVVVKWGTKALGVKETKAKDTQAEDAQAEDAQAENARAEGAQAEVGKLAAEI